MGLFMLVPKGCHISCRKLLVTLSLLFLILSVFILGTVESGDAGVSSRQCHLQAGRIGVLLGHIRPAKGLRIPRSPTASVDQFSQKRIPGSLKESERCIKECNEHPTTPRHNGDAGDVRISDIRVRGDCSLDPVKLREAAVSALTARCRSFSNGAFLFSKEEAAAAVKDFHEEAARLYTEKGMPLAKLKLVSHKYLAPHARCAGEKTPANLETRPGTASEGEHGHVVEFVSEEPVLSANPLVVEFVDMDREAGFPETSGGNERHHPSDCRRGRVRTSTLRRRLGLIPGEKFRWDAKRWDAVANSG